MNTNEVAAVFAEAAYDAGLDRDQQERIARKLADALEEQFDQTDFSFDRDSFEEIAGRRR